MPFRFLAGLWLDEKRGRTLLLGLPSIMMFLFAIVCALIAFGSQANLIQNYESARKRAQETKDRAAAIVYTQKLMQLDPNDRAKYELATLLISDDSLETGAQNRLRAQSMFDSLAPDDRPGYPEAHVRKAQLIASSGNIPQVERVKQIENQLRLALIGDTTNAAALAMTAEIMTLKQDYEGALKIYIGLFTENVAFHRKIAEIYHTLERGDEARYYVEKAIERYAELLKEQPGNLDYIRRIGNAHAMLGAYDTAITFMNGAIAAEPDIADQEILKKGLANVHIARSQSLVNAEFKDDAVARQAFLNEIIDAFRLDPANELSMRLLTEFADAGFPESNAARSVYDPRIDPENADATVLQGIGTRELLFGNRELGISLLEKGLQKNPENHTIMNNLAFALMDVDLERSLSLSTMSIGVAPGVANYYDTHGNILIRMGQFDKAINDFEKAIGLGLKDNAKVFRSLSLCYEKLGMIEDAASYSRRSEEIEKAAEK